VKAGSTLVVPRTQGRHADVSPQVADNAVIALAPDLPPQRKVTLQAGRRDTVASVARRYRVNPAQVAQWNDVTPTASFKAGQTIVVYVANARGGTKGSRTAQAASKSQAGKTAAATGAGARFKAAEKVARKGGTNITHN
jgi:membrane-bound lytic murein transglycosylase D